MLLLEGSVGFFVVVVVSDFVFSFFFFFNTPLISKLCGLGDSPEFWVFCSPCSSYRA